MVVPTSQRRHLGREGEEGGNTGEEGEREGEREDEEWLVCSAVNLVQT